MTHEEMCIMVDCAIRWHKATGADTYQTRLEGQEVPEGLSLTDTGVSQFWRFREGNTVYKIHNREHDKHHCFTISTK